MFKAASLLERGLCYEGGKKKLVRVLFHDLLPENNVWILVFHFGDINT